MSVLNGVPDLLLPVAQAAFCLSMPFVLCIKACLLTCCEVMVQHGGPEWDPWCERALRRTVWQNMNLLMLRVFGCDTADVQNALEMLKHTPERLAE